MLHNSVQPMQWVIFMQLFYIESKFQTIFLAIFYLGSGSFSFNANNNPSDASKGFNFGGSATAPVAAATTPFSFSPATPNAFQFSASPQMQQPAAANLFSIPGGSTTKTGRPIRTATRRINKS